MSYYYRIEKAIEDRIDRKQWLADYESLTLIEKDTFERMPEAICDRQYCSGDSDWETQVRDVRWKMRKWR